METILDSPWWAHAFTASVILAGVANASQAAQLLAIRHELAGGGLLSWSVLRTWHPDLLRSSLRPVVDYLLTPPRYFILLVAQLVCALTIIGLASEPPFWALATLLVLRAVFNFRNSLAIIGADHMQIVVLVACAMFALAPTSAVTQACAWFVSLQLVLSYVASGAWKLASPDWRRGTALRDIFRTRTMGARRGYELLTRFPRLSVGACWGTIVFECLSPWLLFAGPLPAAVFLATGLFFHVGVAIAMGFDEFMWAYLAAYPIAFVCAVELQRAWA